MPYKQDKKMLRVDEEDLNRFQRWQTVVNDNLATKGCAPMSQAFFFKLILDQYHKDIDKWVGVKPTVKGKM